MAPPLLELRSPRMEAALTEQARRQQYKIDDLERKVQSQAALLARYDRSAPATQGGTAAEHMGLAFSHAGQSIATAATAVLSALPCGWVSNRSTTLDGVGATTPPVSVPRGANSQGRSPSPTRAKAEAAQRHGRIGAGLPSWQSTTERHPPLHQHGANSGNLTQRVGDSQKGRKKDHLEDHEYVLEDEWGFVPTHGVINPRSPWKESWDIGILILILYSAVVVPFRICFSAEAEGNMWWVEVGISIIFLIDVGFNFNCSYPIEDKWVISRSRITSRYLSGWFWIDMPASLPVELITAAVGNGEANSHLSLLRFLRLFRLLRLLRLLKVDKYIAVLEDKLEVNLVSLRILGMVTKLCFMVHLLGCFWFYVGSIAAETGEPVTWIATYDDGSAVDGPVDVQYLFSVYWALTTLTTVGYGDITPTNPIERYYCLFAMLVGAMMFGYMMSTIGSMVQQMDRQAAIVEDRMDAVKEWMMSRNMPRKLFTRVRKYYEHYYTKKSAFDEDMIVRGLTPALRQEVTGILLRDSLGHFPLFALLGIDFQRSVYPQLKPLAYANQDVIYQRGDVSEDIFFLRKGTVDVLAGGPGTNVLYRLNQGQYFGEEVLTHQRRGCSVLSNGWTELWSLSRDILDDTMDKFPDLVAKLDEFVVAELERKVRLYNLSYRILIGVCTNPERRAALIMQKGWTSFAAMKARSDSKFAATSVAHARLSKNTAAAGLGSNRTLPTPILEKLQEKGHKKSRKSVDSGSTEDGTARSGASGLDTPTAVGAALNQQLKEMSLVLSGLKREMKSQTALMTKLEGQQNASSAKRPPIGSRSNLEV